MALKVKPLGHRLMALKVKPLGHRLMALKVQPPRLLWRSAGTDVCGVVCEVLG